MILSVAASNDHAGCGQLLARRFPLRVSQRDLCFDLGRLLMALQVVPVSLAVSVFVLFPVVLVVCMQVACNSCVCTRVQEPEAAIRLFHTSLLELGPHPATHYNIGMCSR